MLLLCCVAVAAVAVAPLTVQLRTSELNAIRASWHYRSDRDGEHFVGGALAVGKSRDFSKWRCQTRAGRLFPALSADPQPMDGPQQVISIHGSRPKRVKLVSFSSIERSPPPTELAQLKCELGELKTRPSAKTHSLFVYMIWRNCNPHATNDTGVIKLTPTHMKDFCAVICIIDANRRCLVLA